MPAKRFESKYSWLVSSLNLNVANEIHSHLHIVNDFLNLCRRRYKSGIVAGTKADSILQRKSAQNGGPDVGWRMFDDPEPEFGVVDEGDGGFRRA